MSVDEYTYKFLKLLQYMGQAYDSKQKNAKRYAIRLHFRYSSMILAAKRDSFNTIINAARKMEAIVIIQGTMKQ